jgi:GNAT superfamily N-acetyltransferase
MNDDQIIVTQDGATRWTLTLDRRGDELGHVHVVKKRLRIDRAEIPTGGVVGLSTSPQHRLKGYGRRLMGAAHEFLAQQGCLISLLNGIPNFYGRFGYAVVFPVCRLLLHTDGLSQARPIHQVRPVRKKDEPALVRLYNRCNQYRTGTLIRPPDWRFSNLTRYSRPPGKLILVEDHRQAIAGYALYRYIEDRLFVQELNAKSPQAYETLAHALGQRARRSGLALVHCKVPFDHPFGALCSRYGTRWEIEQTVDVEEMGRILTLAGFIDRLRSAFEHRLRAAVFLERLVLRFDTDLGPVGLEIDHGRVQTVNPCPSEGHRINLPQNILLQLAMGYLSIDAAVYNASVHISPSTKLILEILFPRTNAVMPMIME